MIEHVSLGTHALAASVRFYAAILSPLGVSVQRNTEREVAFGTDAQWSFFLYPVAPSDSVAASGMHVALAASSRAIVEAVHRSALEAGGADLFTPRLRPDISATYFGAMFTDLDGHRIEVMTNAA